VWRHTHHFEQQPDNTTFKRDVIDFAAPYELLRR
jgi:ligand-binding SRPBCC domain-containing protein